MPSDLAAPDDSGPEPRYRQVASDIASRIASGELPSGTRLRSERELAEYYEIAYATLRKAMAVLRERGLVRIEQGRGTYVI